MELKEMKNLVSLVYSDFLISETGVKELKESLPKLKVVRLNVTRSP